MQFIVLLIHARAFLEIDVPEPMQGFQGRNCDSFLIQCRLRARRSRGSNSDFHLCPIHTEMSPDSQKHLLILCTVDAGISLLICCKLT